MSDCIWHLGEVHGSVTETFEKISSVTQGESIPGDRLEHLETQKHTVYKPDHCFTEMKTSKKLPHEVSAYNYNLAQPHGQIFRKSVPLLEKKKSM